MTQRYAIGPRETAAMTTAELRENFLIETLFVPGEVTLVYTHYDRMILGAAVPTDAPLSFGDGADVGTPRFFDAREMGIANLGGAGWVEVDVTSDIELEKEYGERVPVILLDGREHGYWRVEETRLLRDLAAS